MLLNVCRRDFRMLVNQAALSLVVLGAPGPVAIGQSLPPLTMQLVETQPWRRSRPNRRRLSDVSVAARSHRKFKKKWLRRPLFVTGL
jgi:hypothetical protein